MQEVFTKYLVVLCVKLIAYLIKKNFNMCFKLVFML